MPITLTTGSVHHFALTVTNVERAVEFYTELLGFQMVMELGPRRLLSNGSVILALIPPPHPTQAIQGDRFSENRVGLDHISLNVARRAELKRRFASLTQRAYHMVKSKILALTWAFMYLPSVTLITFSLNSLRRMGKGNTVLEVGG